MPTLDIHASSPLHDSFRVRQIAGLFDLPLPERNQFHIKATLPDESDNWQIGLILGPSGSGKSTLARHAYRNSYSHSALSTHHSSFPSNQALIDCFPNHLPIKQITRTLTAVGLSSPPSWLKPYSVLSTGEKFRAELAAAALRACDAVEEKDKETRRPGDKEEDRDKETGRHGDKEKTPAISNRAPTSISLSPCLPFSLSFPARPVPIVTFDEFATPLDTRSAQFASRALSRSIRKGSLPIRLVAVTCRQDIIPHLAPDWIFDTSTCTLSFPKLKLPPLDLQVRKSSRADWPLFAPHHYLSHTLHPGSHCFTGYIDNQPAVFTAVIAFPHPIRPGYREHRTVCLPAYQGIGLGSAMSDYIASIFTATHKPYFSRTSHPAMIAHRMKSNDWKLIRPPGMVSRSSISSLNTTKMSNTLSRGRNTAGFEYVGLPRPGDAKRFCLLVSGVPASRSDPDNV